MRVMKMKMKSQSLGVSPEQEQRWPALATNALQAAVDGRDAVPSIWFRTDTGAVGSIPVSDEFPISFTDEVEPVDFLGTITLLGREAAPSNEDNH
jgi:hypothetical protein